MRQSPPTPASGRRKLAGRFAVLTLERFISITATGLIGTLFPVLAMII
ncbi:MAG: hypothetical protein HC794_05760 [Nitrospiraceae bacterium]|nr:hypothetical protein [Nitrospiraceae bacterium]